MSDATAEKRMDFLREGALGLSVNDGDELVQTGIFKRPADDRAIFKAALIHMVICTNDLLREVDRIGKRVDWRDDISQESGSRDVTDVINSVRNAACHSDSGNHLLDGNRFSFNMIVGKGVLMKMGKTMLDSDYEDDIAVFYGSTRLYVHRQLLAAYREAKNRLMSR